MCSKIWVWSRMLRSQICSSGRSKLFFYLAMLGINCNTLVEVSSLEKVLILHVTVLSFYFILKNKQLINVMICNDNMNLTTAWKNRNRQIATTLQERWTLSAPQLLEQGLVSRLVLISLFISIVDILSADIYSM